MLTMMIYKQEQLDPLVGAPGLLAYANQNGDTALHRCAALGHADCVDWLLERAKVTDESVNFHDIMGQ